MGATANARMGRRASRARLACTGMPELLTPRRWYAKRTRNDGIGAFHEVL